MSSPYATEIAIAAQTFQLDPLLVTALVDVESSFHPYAWNPEPRYRYFWDVRKKAPFRPVTASEVTSEYPPTDFRAVVGDPDQEWWGQQASWGLMQVMGAVARELGCLLPYLTQLTDPATNLTYGCKKLAGELRWSKGDVPAALASYNGGRSGNKAGGPLRNAEYAYKILTRLESLKTPASR